MNWIGSGKPFPQSERLKIRHDRKPPRFGYAEIDGVPEILRLRTTKLARIKQVTCADNSTGEQSGVMEGTAPNQLACTFSTVQGALLDHLPYSVRRARTGSIVEARRAGAAAAINAASVSEAVAARRMRTS